MSNYNKEEISNIMKKMIEGDNKALEELYEKYSKMIYGVAFSILKNSDDSEDIVQNVFTKIYNMDKKSLPTASEGTWLYTVTKNEALLLIRKKDNSFDINSIYDIKDNNDQIEKLIDKVTFNKLISKLNIKEKEIISLKIISNLSFSEISNCMGESIGTIKWRYYNAIYSLRSLITNLTMSILAFIFGIKTYKNEKKSRNIEQEKRVFDNSEDKSLIKEESIEDKSILTDSLKEKEYNEFQENIIVDEPVNIENKTNYMGISLFVISLIFLIISFTIFFKKHQPKTGKKSSK